MSDFPILAPRPVRLTTASIFAGRSQNAHNHMNNTVRIMSAPHDVRACSTSSDVETGYRLSPLASPLFDKDRTSTSPRLPSEAVEEFLSILRPSSRTFSSLQVHQPSPTYNRSSMLSQSTSFGSGLSGYYSTLFAWEETHRDEAIEGIEGESITPEISKLATQPVRWFAQNALSSPISRLNTRNPFHRHPSYAATPPRTPSVAPSAANCRVLSPANIPLPPSPIPI